MRNTQLRVAAAGVAVAAVAVVTPMVWHHLARAEDIPSTVPTPEVSAPVSPVAEVEAPEVTATPMVEDDTRWDLTSCRHRSLHDTREEAEALAAHLNSLGHEARVTDEEGHFAFRLSDGGVAARIAIDEYLWEKEPWPASRVEQCNALEGELAAYLRARGIEVEVLSSRYGVTYLDPKGAVPQVRGAEMDFLVEKGEVTRVEHEEPEHLPPLDPETEKAEVQALVDHLTSLGFEAGMIKVGDGHSVDADLDDVDLWIAMEEFEWEKNPMSPQEIEENNRGEEALAAHLRARGIECEVKTSRYGVKYTDYGRDEATEQVVAEFWEEYTRNN